MMKEQHYDIHQVLECSCFGDCNSRRYIKTLHPIKLTEHVFSVCNETIRIRFAEENINRDWSSATFEDVAKKYILPEIMKFIGISEYKNHIYGKTNPDSFNFYWIGRPLNLAYEMKYVDMIKFLYDNRYIDYRIEINYRIMEIFKYSFKNYLDNLMKFKKFKKQHDVAEKLLKKIVQCSCYWDDAEFIELAELLFNLKINQNEAS